MLTPDDQARDPYGWVANQAGHAVIIGAGLCGALLWLPPGLAVALAAAAYFLVWEWAYQIKALRSKLYRDALADTLNVAFGAGMAAAVGPDPLFWSIWGAWIVVLGIGAWWRA